jgi:excisionase family DNA binding protein
MKARLNPNDLTQADLEALQQRSRAFGEAARGSAGPSVLLQVGDERLELPPALASLIARTLAEVAEGRSVEMRSTGDVLTTSEAADLLAVSRPYLVGLLDSGAIPSWKTGSHRRVRRDHVLAYRRAQRAETADALDRLTEEGLALDLGYSDLGYAPDSPGASS